MHVNFISALVEHDCLAAQEDVTVNLAEIGKLLGAFKWPTGKDIHTVSRRSVVATEVEYRPIGGGRLWLVTNAKAIQKAYNRFS